MAENINNILVYYNEEKVMFRVTKIRNGTVVEVDELVEDKNLAINFLDNLVENTESAYGFKGQYSESAKNRILGDRALVLVRFGNLGVEIGISVKPIVKRFENLKNVHIASQEDYMTLSKEPQGQSKKSFMDKIMSFVK